MSFFRRLLVLLLPGVLPLLVYGIASELWGDIVGAAIGCSLGLIELIVILIRQRRLDWFILLDISLIVVVAIVSVVKTNALVFKLKPVFIELIMAVVIVVSALGPRNLLLGMALRGKAGQKLQANLEQVSRANRSMRKFLIGLCAVMVLHMAATVISALYANKATWLFVSGPGLFMLTGLWVTIYLLLRRRLIHASGPAVNNKTSATD